MNTTRIGERAPLVSIFMFVRNRAVSIRRAVDSVLAQTYPNIEFLVQDAVSTDGTLEVLKSYGDRIKLVSAPDSGPTEGLWISLNRCTGDFMGSCLSDEELVPDATERAVEALLRSPDVGAVTGDAIITDLEGVESGAWKSAPFNFVDYLLCDYTPYFVSSFFRRQALLDAGLKSDAWGKDCVEFELWCRLATRTRIEYIPGANAKYASHAGQSSNDTRDVIVHFEGRLKQIADICSPGGFVGENPLLRTLFIWGHARAFINHAVAFKRPETAAALYAITLKTLSIFPRVELDGIPYDGDFGVRQSARLGREKIVHRIPAFIRHGLGQNAMHSIGTNVEARLLAARYDGTLPTASPLKALLRGAALAPAAMALPPPIDNRLKARMYALFASRYEQQERPHEALRMWKAIARLLDTGEVRALPAEESAGYTHAQK